MTRAEALELLNKFEFCCDFSQCTNDWECEECCEALNMAIKALEQVPKWESEFVCETCGYEIPHLTKAVGDVVLMDSKDWNYCPNCGVIMESDEE